MASLCGRARHALQSTTTRNAVVSKFTLPKSSSLPKNSPNLHNFTASTKPKSPSFLSPHRLFSSTRIPVELGCAQSLMPLHSVTASALLTSLLSLHAQSWGALSEGTIVDDS
ncbi:hypothetical protein vseg_002158 [Gypsophila vaccaria]